MVKYYFQKNNKNLLLHIQKSNVKFLINNFLPLYLWNLSELINPESFKILSFLGFLNKFFHLILSCFVVFVVPSIVFNLIYGDNFYINRQKYKFLIEKFHPANKGFYLTLLFFKIFLGTFISFYYYFQDGNNYSIIGVNLFALLYHILIKYYYYPIYLDKKNHSMSIVSLSVSLIISILSQINRYIIDQNASFILQIFEISLFGIMILGYIFNRYYYKKE